MRNLTIFHQFCYQLCVEKSLDFAMKKGLKWEILANFNNYTGIWSIEKSTDFSPCLLQWHMMRNFKIFQLPLSKAINEKYTDFSPS